MRLKLCVAESLKRIKTNIWIIQTWIFWRFRCREQVTDCWSKNKINAKFLCTKINSFSVFLWQLFVCLFFKLLSLKMASEYLVYWSCECSSPPWSIFKKSFAKCTLRSLLFKRPVLLNYLVWIFLISLY